MHPILAIAIKDVRLLLRDRMGAIFTLGFPLAFAMFFGMIFSGSSSSTPASMDIVVVDQDASARSRQLVDDLKASDAVEVQTAPDIDGARALVRGRKAAAGVVITKGFGAALDRPFWGESAAIELISDPSRTAEVGMLQGVVMELAYKQFQASITDTNAMAQMSKQALADMDTLPPDEQARLAPLRTFLPSLESFMQSMQDARSTDAQDDEQAAQAAGQPVTVTTSSVIPEQRTSGYAMSFTQGMIWGVMSAAITMALTLVIERRTGTLIRLRVAPIPQGTILAGKALACGLVILGVLALLTIIGVVGFGVAPTSYPLLALAAVSTAIGFVGIMMVIAAIAKTEAVANGLGWGGMLGLAMIGGAMVPSFLMPKSLQTLGLISPVRWGLEGLEGAIWRDYSLGQMLLPCGALIALGVVGFAIGARIFAWTSAD